MDQKDETPSWKDDPLWYKDAIIYQLHIKAFFDSNGDGIGDIRGLTEKLDYIQNLGVNTLWLLPFYPSPLKDDGYDIADYRNVHPDYGTRRDFKFFVREAHRRGLKVITELVINHTSDQHPWFQAARKAPPGSSKRDFYVWSDTDTKYPETRIIFTDTETSNWAWDPEAQAYYWHRFFSHQPDLNHNNPHVVDTITRVMRFWLDMGVDGMRLDAIPYLCLREGTNNENLPETHAVLKKFRAVLDAHHKNRMLLAEANQWPEDVREYFGDGDECHMAYHFPLMPRIYMAVAQEDRHPITEIMQQTPDIPENCQWAIFLRNHDELTLEMVTNRERDYMYKTYSEDPRMRINVGIRRRLAPLMENDIDKIKLLNSLLLSFPGTPILYYGDEIGMGDNIFLGDRNGVRTPMQWSPDRNAGFSRADPQRLYLPPIMDPVYGYEAVNVEAQSREPSSLLNWMKRVITVRKSHKAFGRGALKFLQPGNRKILAYVREFDGEIILCVANLSRTAQPVELDLSGHKGRVPVELMGRTPFPAIGELPYLLTLAGYGFYWFRLTTEAEAPRWHEDRLPPLEMPILVLFEGWNSFFAERVESNKQFMAKKLKIGMEGEVLRHFIPEQRWYAAKRETIEKIEFAKIGAWQSGQGNWLLAEATVHFSDRQPQTYFLPLALAWDEGDEEAIRFYFVYTLAKVRQGARIGVMFDAFADSAFCWELVQAMGRNDSIAFDQGKLNFSSTQAFASLTEKQNGPLEVKRPQAEGSNTTVILGNKLFLKGYRNLQSGKNPELEMGRFLTETSPFENIVPLAGALEYELADGTRVALALLQGYVDTQGDAWSYTLEYLQRFFEDCLLKPQDEVWAAITDYHAVFLNLMNTLGARTGELHQALGKQTGNPDFDPEPISKQDLDSWVHRVGEDVKNTQDMLELGLKSLPDSVQGDAQYLRLLKPAMLDRLAQWAPSGLQAMKTRYHGDLHLGQVLITQNDFIFIDFEGEPARPLAERRLKHSPLRDAAGILRSFNYAVFAALRPILADRPNDAAVLNPFAKDWQEKACRAFLTGYEAAMQGCASFPSEPEHTRAMIDLFTLEKALYELRYELENRPDWVGIPISGLLNLMADDAKGE